MLGQTTLDWASPIIQLATGGGFAALVWYLVVKHIPAIEDRHRSERLELLQYIEKRDDKQDAITREFVDEMHNVRTTLERLAEERRA